MLLQANATRLENISYTYSSKTINNLKYSLSLIAFLPILVLLVQIWYLLTVLNASYITLDKIKGLGGDHWLPFPRIYKPYTCRKIIEY